MPLLQQEQKPGKFAPRFLYFFIPKAYNKKQQEVRNDFGEIEASLNGGAPFLQYKYRICWDVVLNLRYICFLN